MGNNSLFLKRLMGHSQNQSKKYSSTNYRIYKPKNSMNWEKKRKCVKNNCIVKLIKYKGSLVKNVHFVWSKLLHRYLDITIELLF